ncbi:hypothetical protein [Actinoplanes sp. HUAS TT8]|uniref:hypothetical protein n=1 Tax=Actinoplanes sp. HUAS TT8 TaxID=3447453 RepID=UPI003F51CD10
METLTQVRSGIVVERLLGHPSLPLIAGWDTQRPAIHIWDGDLREIGAVGRDTAAYGDRRHQHIPSAAWHPTAPHLIVADRDTVTRWTPTGVHPVGGLAPIDYRRDVAFSPDGRTLWVSNPPVGLDPGTGTTITVPRWDTGITAHPAGGLLTLLQSDQGATLLLFARDTGPQLRPLRRGLILSADGYETPVFSPDGRHLAVRGNAYGNAVQVFAFPSLRCVLGATLGRPNPGYPYPKEWLDQMNAWSGHNIAYGRAPGVLWIGTPQATLIALDGEHPNEHPMPAAVTALTATPAGDLLAADADGTLHLLATGPHDPAEPAPDTVTAFLATTTEATEVHEDHLDLTDGLPDDGTAPPWLQIPAA